MIKRRNMASIKKRIKAVRGEVINFLSFLSVVWTLWEDESSTKATIFILSGIMILMIDGYFIRCQWNFKSNRAILGTRCKTASLDDLLSDLPQTLWVLGYVTNFKFSIIAIVCALHSGFSILEDLCGMHDDEENNNVLPVVLADQEMHRLND
jgi:hypothetical protein